LENKKGDGGKLGVGSFWKGLWEGEIGRYTLKEGTLKLMGFGDITPEFSKRTVPETERG